MLRKLGTFLLFSFVLLYGVSISSISHACGHEGIYVGIGYLQQFMYTPEHRMPPNSNRRVLFSPGFGASALVGYDFPGSRWGIQFPFEYVRLRLNKAEWVNYFGSDVEGVLHLIEWSNGFDIHLVGGLGWTYLSEGRYYDNTSAFGIKAGIGPGFSYYFSRTEKVSASFTVEVPFRYVYYFKDRLSRNGTSAIQIPVRLSVQIGF